MLRPSSPRYPRASLAAAALSLTASLCCGRPASIPTTTLEGKILGSDGRPLADAHAVMHVDSVPGIEVRARAGRSGDFVVTVPAGQRFVLSFSGVDHQEAHVEMFLEAAAAPGRIEVRLAHNIYRDPIEQVRIIGDWTDVYGLIEWDRAEPMSLQADGTFAFETKTRRPKVRYQVLDVVTDRRGVNGTQSQGYDYDGNGGYTSIVRAQGGSVRITFDPSRLERDATPDLPTATWAPPHEYLTDLARIGFREDRLHRWPTPSVSAGGDFEAVTGESEAKRLRAELDRLMTESPHKLVREFAAMHRIRWLEQPGSPERAAAIERVLGVVPPASRAWSYWFESAELLALLMEKDRQVAFLQQVLEQNADEHVQARALARLVAIASTAGDDARWRHFYWQLRKHYAHLRVVQFDLERFDPDWRLAPGKAVPAFRLDLLDGSTLTSDELRGKTYLLEFWATWCGPCREQVPNLANAYRDYAGRGLEIISVSVDRDRRDLERFLRERHVMTWTQALAEGSTEGQLARAFGITGIPEAVLVGPDGTILAAGSELRGEELLRTLKRRFRERGSRDGGTQFSPRKAT